MNQLQPLPKRLAWFAPWTWRRRVIVAILSPLLLTVVYVLSLLPAVMLGESGCVGCKQVARAYRPVLQARYQLPCGIRHSADTFLMKCAPMSARLIMVEHFLTELYPLEEVPMPDESPN